jgi:nucleoid-associated protein YgaU
VPGTAAAVDGSATVEPGDSLWVIAARHLPADATDSDIDTTWRAWYSANAEVIGANPDLIIPGQHLLPGHTEMRP